MFFFNTSMRQSKFQSKLILQILQKLGIIYKVETHYIVTQRAMLINEIQDISELENSRDDIWKILRVF